MSRKYIAQINNDNFIFPNNKMVEYDVDIIHDLKENNVSGSTTSFYISYSGSNITINFDYHWVLNGAEPFINNNGKVNILSVHLMSPNKKYFKPWVCVGLLSDSNTSVTTKSGTFTATITPQMMSQLSFVDGLYYFEIRYIGHRSVFPIMGSASLVTPSPTPTPTPSVTPTHAVVTPTPTPTPTSTTTPTPTTPGFIGNTLYFGSTADIACSGAVSGISVNITGDTSTFCSSTSFTGNTFAYQSTGTYYIAYLGQTRQMSLTYGSQIATSLGSCTTCPGVSPTPTPTSTNTPTPTPTSTSLVPTYQFYLGYDLSSGPSACSDYNPSTDYFWSTCSILSSGCNLLTTADPTSSAPPNGYYSNGTNFWYFTGGMLVGETSCSITPTPTPTPTLPPVGVGIYTGSTFGSSALACADSNYPNGGLYLPHGDTISNGDVLYTDPGCTNPYNGASNFYRIYQAGFYGCQIGAFGTVSNLLDCSASPTPTPTPTPTSSPTPAPFLYSFSIWIGTAGSSGTACQMTGSEYTVYNDVGYLVDGGTVYSDGLGDVPFPGGMSYYSDGSTVGRISNGGLYTQETNCSI